MSDREISKTDADNKNDNNFHEAQIQSSIEPAANCEVPTAFCTSINAGIQTEPCSRKPPLCPSTRVESVATRTCSIPASTFTHKRAREYKTSAVQTVFVQCSCHFSASAVLRESQTASITVTYETSTVSSSLINTGPQTELSTKPLLRRSTHLESVATQTRPFKTSTVQNLSNAVQCPRHISAVAVLHESQTATITSFAKYHSASASTDNIFSCRALITDLQVAWTHGSRSKNSERARPLFVCHALSQTNEPTVFRRQALIYDWQTTHLSKSIQSRFGHNPYALSAHSAVRFGHKNLWSILKPEYDDKKPAASSEAIFGDNNLPAWQTTTRHKTLKKELEITSASLL